MLNDNPVVVEGIGKLDSTLRKLDRDTQRMVRDEWRVVAEPVRGGAETLARSQISHMTGKKRWSLMRTGVTRHTVYVAPRQKGIKGQDPRKRRKFARILREKAMEPALEQNRRKVVDRVELMLSLIVANAGRR